MNTPPPQRTTQDPLENLEVHHLGPIAEANLRPGDLTLLIGPQASGKSIILQLIKLILDSPNITRTIKRHGFDWKGNTRDFLALYFGEGMGNIWSEGTQISADHRPRHLTALTDPGPSRAEQLFYVPAQRVLTLQNGWPRAFTNYGVTDPYVVKHFSEHLRLLMEQGLGGRGQAIFPQEGRMKKALRQCLDASIFHGAQVELDTTSLQKRIVLSLDGNHIPYMTWSAGQREFIPLLLGLYWLMPSTSSARKSNIRWVVIEEPEMGLHPRGISALMLMMLELLHRGYKLLVSTHSPLLLEMVWAIGRLKDCPDGAKRLHDLFHIGPVRTLTPVFNTVLKEKTFATYFFERPDSAPVSVKDISTLDPADADEAISGWGGLTEFSGRASEVVSAAMAEQE